MDWLQTSEDFVGGYGWGIQGRYMRISRMFVDQDKMNISKDIFLASYRPRGILSGFLAIVPTLNHAVFIPPPGSKQKALRIRIRLSDSLSTADFIQSHQHFCRIVSCSESRHRTQ